MNSVPSSIRVPSFPDTYTKIVERKKRSSTAVEESRRGPQEMAGCPSVSSR
jgi:hypothetical protein